MTDHPSGGLSLVHEAEMATPLAGPLAGGLACVLSRRSPAKSTRNEDCALLLPLGDRAGILVVADGVGGGRAGADASNVAMHELIERLESPASDTPSSRREAILQAIESASREIAALGVGAGTTLALAEIDGRTVRPYHVGDSQVLVVGQQGKLKHLTIAHSPVGYAVEAGLLDEIEAMHHADRHLIFNMVGIADMRIEIGPRIELAERDTVLLYSDGLADNLHTNEIVELVRCGPLEEAVAALGALASARMEAQRPDEPHKPDDLTIVAWRADF